MALSCSLKNKTTSETVAQLSDWAGCMRGTLFLEIYVENVRIFAEI